MGELGEGERSPINFIAGGFLGQRVMQNETTTKMCIRLGKLLTVRPQGITLITGE